MCISLICHFEKNFCASFSNEINDYYTFTKIFIAPDQIEKIVDPVIRSNRSIIKSAEKDKKKRTVSAHVVRITSVPIIPFFFCFSIMYQVISKKFNFFTNNIRSSQQKASFKEQSTGPNGDGVTMALPALRRSESASSSRSSRYIYVNNYPYVVIDLLGKGGSSKVRIFSQYM